MTSTNLRQLISVHKKNLIDIYKYAVEAVKPDKLMLDSLNLDGNTLTVKNNYKSDGDHADPVEIDFRDKNVHILGGGKCVLSMAKGFAEVISRASGVSTSSFSHGCLSLPVGLKDDYDIDATSKVLLSQCGIECLFGSKNNLPDENSVIASEFLLKQVADACGKDKLDNRQSLFIVLISGGGSACLSSPKYISLTEKLRLIGQLVEKGANIVELNQVRRYFSNIKAGNLARHILRNNTHAQVLTLLLSDVIGDPIEFIASGPTYLDGLDESQAKQQHYQSMCNVLSKYELEFPPGVSCSTTALDEAGTRCDHSSVINKVIGNNRIALEAVVSKAESLGYVVRCLGDSMKGPTEQVVEQILEVSSAAERGIETTGRPMLFCCGGETTVEKHPGESWGKGGRAQEMALDYMIARLTECGVAGAPSTGALDVFLAGGTDGQDGPTDVAACLASKSELSSASCDDSVGQDQTRALDLAELKRAKRRHDSYNFWQSTKPDWLVRTGLTGTNVMDLYLYLVAPREQLVG